LKSKFKQYLKQNSRNIKLKENKDYNPELNKAGYYLLTHCPGQAEKIRQIISHEGLEPGQASP